MSEATFSWVWAGVTGLIGGGLNALITDNMRLFPMIITVSSHHRLFRPGFLANICVGAAATFGCFVALAGTDCVISENAATAGLRLGLAGAAIGLLTARCLTNETDNQLLRVAVCKASAAPAAHPDTVRALEAAPPRVIYATVDQMMPRHLGLNNR